jgi:hypothetical protein
MNTEELIDFILAVIKGIGALIFFIAMAKACKEIDDMTERMKKCSKEEN